MVSDDLGDLGAADADVEYLAVDADLGAVGTGGERVSLDHALGGRVAVAGLDTASEIVPLHQWA